MLNFINEFWTAFTESSGETYITACNIGSETPPTEQAKIARLVSVSADDEERYPYMEENTKLIAHAPDPFNIDRILGASYNTRSVLETLITITREFPGCCIEEIR
ncbi:MAG: hypothetical protein II832_07720 [Synergistaceae bacterium]|nr:hypothetical protein [Synergistaceae bacterium]MBQ6971556.1 hypothetical protein [Synergistaceae bacterium]